MKKSREPALRQWTGDLNALCGWTDFTYNDGPARGMRAFSLRNGRGMEMTVLADRALDIPSLFFKGMNVGFNGKTGLRSPYLYTEDGNRGFLKQFNAGLLTTCGLTYAGSSCVEEGRALGLHGPVGNLPASRVGARMSYEGDDAVIRIQGEVRESCIFEENVLLSRTLTLETERNVLRIDDVVENQGFRREPLMLVYHINFGYPLLDEGARVYSSARDIAPRNETAQEGLSAQGRIEAPTVGREEECFLHTGFPEGGAFAMLHNEALGLAAVVCFDAEALPLLCQWKCMRAGEYVLGLEPTTSGVESRADARENGLLAFLEPGQRRAFSITIALEDDPDAIAMYRRKANA